MTEPKLKLVQHILPNQREDAVFLTNEKEEIRFRPIERKASSKVSRERRRLPVRHAQRKLCPRIKYLVRLESSQWLTDPVVPSRGIGKEHSITWPLPESSWCLWLNNRSRKVFSSPTNLHHKITILVGFAVKKTVRELRPVLGQNTEKSIVFSKIIETYSTNILIINTKPTVWASDCIFCVKTVRSVSTVFSSLATWEEVWNYKAWRSKKTMNYLSTHGSSLQFKLTRTERTVLGKFKSEGLLRPSEVEVVREWAF